MGSVDILAHRPHILRVGSIYVDRGNLVFSSCPIQDVFLEIFEEFSYKFYFFTYVRESFPFFLVLVIIFSSVLFSILYQFSCINMVVSINFQ
jgi:hypothetical protein